MFYGIAFRFVTGSNDRTIKIWDLASGVLKLTLTGHISIVRALCVSNRHPYLFSTGDDKTVSSLFCVNTRILVILLFSPQIIKGKMLGLGIQQSCSPLPWYFLWLNELISLSGCCVFHFWVHWRFWCFFFFSRPSLRGIFHEYAPDPGCFDDGGSWFLLQSMGYSY